MARHTSDPPPPLTSGRQRVLLGVFGLVLFALGLALTEGVLALLDIGEARRFDDPFVGFAPGVPVFDRSVDQGGRAVWKTSEAKLAFFEPQQFAATKPEGGLRIFAVGGSTTAGRPYDHRFAFPAWLERYLRAAEPERPVEVVNAGAISYASYRAALVMQELAQYEPDLFVVYTGHNEFLEQRSYGEIIHQQPIMKELSFLLARSRLASLARDGLERWRAPARTILAAEVETRLEGWNGLDRYHRDEALASAIVKHFESNLRRMVAIARHAGAEIVFVLPIANLLDFSPFKSEHSVGLAVEARSRFAGLLANGVSHHEAGRPEAALIDLDAAITIDPGFAEAHFRRGRALFALSRMEAAGEALIAAKEHDVAPLRAREALIDRIRAVAAREEVPIIDLPALMGEDSRSRLGHTILGDQYLLDHVHPTPEVHGRLAEALLDWAARRGLTRADPAATAERRRELFTEIMASLGPEDEARKDFALARVLGWAGKLAEAEAPLLRAAAAFPDDPEIRLALGILYQKTGRVEDARTVLEQATEGQPDSARAFFNLGVVKARAGDLDGGIEALKRAVDLDADDAEALHNLGVLLRRRGDLERAVVMLEHARRRAPGVAAVHRNLGIAYRRQERLDQARTSLERARSLDAADPQNPLELAITLARSGDLTEARALLEDAVGLDPRLAEAHFNLGKIANQEGRTDDAEAAYRLALAADRAHPQAANNLAILLAAGGALAEAASLLEKATASAPAYADGHFNLGLIRNRQSAWADADEAFGRALALDPENGRYHQAIGMTLLGRDEIDRARDHLVRARDLGVALPEDLVTRLGLAP